MSGAGPSGSARPGPAGDVARLAPGLRGIVRAVVTDADTADAMGSGDVPVLATPRLLALAEAAAVAAVAGHLEPGLTSVGTAASLEHRSASPRGAEVVVVAELTAVTGKEPAARRLTGTRLAFRFRAVSPGSGRGDTLLGEGSHERVIVDRARFLAQASVPQ